MILRALLSADIYSALKSGERKVSTIGDLVVGILTSKETELCSNYRTGREEIGSILGMLTRFGTNLEPILSDLQSRISHQKTFELGCDVSIDADGGIDMESNKVYEEEERGAKWALELASFWLEYTVQTCPFLTAACVSMSLIPITLGGCGHKDIEVAKICQAISYTAVNAVRLHLRREQDDNLSIFLPRLVSSFSSSSSWRMKEYALVSIGILLLNNNFVLSAEEKKKCKVLFVECFLDSKVELQTYALFCMTIYLSSKPIEELKTLAEAYTKNCSILAERYNTLCYKPIFCHLVV